MKTVLFATAEPLWLKPQKSFQRLDAESVAQVLDRFVETNGRIDLLVIDTDFDPGVSTIDVALNLRRFFPRLKILFTYSSVVLCTTRQRTALGVLPRDCAAFLRRPISTQELRYRIERILSTALLKAA